MSVVKVDDRGRLTLSRELKGADKAVVINAGTFIVVIPLPKHPEIHALGWLASKTSSLKKAEEKAREDAVSRGFTLRRYT
ncbi:hypothetical protein B9Q03_13155 [Candidatus Marsarchaeota G2 archaeon OSP_D]|jgi:hypothetical protein|uniref:VapB-type antitoxin n=2 Tax=Candidatus Marsarchaeota TaxID=1978152 RepID=A0A2R6AKS9_9ARCH|nr:MAG: hypothetical protein B9Q03_13155 [Candidatus Marsarchaeota G2 archaeon OSP_D]PSN86961.1 MAG: hypothetical protein B9Q00_10115 [Candidatus Marsarchaeota G1 archaeon OSP_C]